MAVSLKHCPFCGHIPVIKERLDEGRGKKYFCISCENEKCRIRPHTDEHITKAVIVREWNRRCAFPVRNK